MTTPKAINDIVTALGGESSADKTVPALKAVYAALGGGGEFPDTIPEALEMIASVAEPPRPAPAGTITIKQNGNNVDVSQYAKANVQVPSPNPYPLKIVNNSANTVGVLGGLGTYSGTYATTQEINVSASEEGTLDFFGTTFASGRWGARGVLRITKSGTASFAASGPVSILKSANTSSGGEYTYFLELNYGTGGGDATITIT